MSGVPLSVVRKGSGPLADAMSPGTNRATWSGLIQLRLVNIPVKGYPATAAPAALPCHQLHAGCGQRIRYLKHCPRHGDIDSGAIVSGYEYAPDQHLVLDPKEIEKLRPTKDRALQLEHFLDNQQVDPLLFAGRSLYLLPNSSAAQPAYSLLVGILHERQKVAVGRVVLSQRRHLVLVRPARALLLMHLLHYPAQLRNPVRLQESLNAAPVTDAEKQMAGLLIDACSQPFRWTDFQDDSAAALAAVVQAKLGSAVSGKTE